MMRTVLVVAGLAVIAGAARTAADRDGAAWRTIGQDPANSRNQPSEHAISAATARRVIVPPPRPRSRPIPPDHANRP